MHCDRKIIRNGYAAHIRIAPSIADRSCCSGSYHSPWLRSCPFEHAPVKRIVWHTLALVYVEIESGGLEHVTIGVCDCEVDRYAASGSIPAVCTIGFTIVVTDLIVFRDHRNLCCWNGSYRANPLFDPIRTQCGPGDCGDIAVCCPVRY